MHWKILEFANSIRGACRSFQILSRCGNSMHKVNTRGGLVLCSLNAGQDSMAEECGRDARSSE
jgi:hypothetical protein